MKKIAIIPARGGSKRIPRKNIKNFLGKPIIAYSIEAALNSDLFDEIMVSTDDEEIAMVARKYGAKVPFMRSAGTSDDFATTVDVLSEVLDQYAESEGKAFDYGCCVYPTAPFSTALQLFKGFEKLRKGDYDTLFPVVAYSNPVWRGLKIEEQKVKMLWPEYQSSRTQDLPKVYHDAGQWYWFNVKRLKDRLFTANSGSIEIGEKEVQDIDNEQDWLFAEMKYKYLNSDAGEGNFQS